jgi:bacterioferritin-associated ferredoxin
MGTTKICKVSLRGGDEVEVCLDLGQDGEILSSTLTGIGGPQLLSLLSEWRGKLKGRLTEVALPSGTTSADMMIRELLLKVRGEWKPPYTDEELCHCRSVPTKIVEQAIVMGADSPEIVSRWTSASTACGTCRKDVEALVAYRKKCA